MKESIKKQYYKLDSISFSKLLDSIYNNPDTISLLDKKYCFCIDNDINTLLIKLHNNQKDFEVLFNNFSDFGKKQIIQSFLIDEIQASNHIESIVSTRHDIFYLINNNDTEDKKIRSIINSYSALLSNKSIKVDSLESIKDLYEVLMKDLLDDKNKPDGKYFRKENVYINDGINNVHSGFYPEERIIEGMNDFIKVFNDESLDVYIRLALSHFLFETIHPYYDGNGRMGRLLNALCLYQNSDTYLCLSLSKIIDDNKSKYYRLLQETRDDREKGILNYYVYEFLNMINDGFKEVIRELSFKKDLIESYEINKYSKTSNRIIRIILEASILSDYGVNIDELIKHASASKRSIAYTIDTLKKENRLLITRISRNNYYKLVDYK